MMKENVTIPCGSIALEGILERPNSLEENLPAAVVCHSHPLYGGNMQEAVSRTVATGLAERGMVSLRFNFRGVGRSGGTFGDAVDELDDVRAALDFLEHLDGIDMCRVMLAGFSFGCWVGLQAGSRDPRPSRLVGISPPVNGHDMSFLSKAERPILLIAGGQDDLYCSEQTFKEFIELIPEPKRAVILPESDHFHNGREYQLVSEINQFLDSYPWNTIE
jgi:alpha/beta superfamily hydrolase